MVNIRQRQHPSLFCYVTLLIILMIGIIDMTYAQSINIATSPTLRVEEDALVVSAQFEINLTPVLEDALQRGFSLYFVREFELFRSQKYWLDERMIESSQSWRLDYYALTRQYRLSSGLFHQNVNSLSDALRLLQRTQSWKVADRTKLPKGTFDARIRLRFDSTRLPTPLQLDMFNLKEWNLISGWYKWSVNL
jgi:Domain of unknown function (DUF4390)